jgi:hypothetical protein
MAYGLNPDSYLEDGPTVLQLRSRSNTAYARAWRALDATRRLSAVESALRHANDDLPDGFPIAL